MGDALTSQLWWLTPELLWYILLAMCQWAGHILMLKLTANCPHPALVDYNYKSGDTDNRTCTFCERNICVLNCHCH